MPLTLILGPMYSSKTTEMLKHRKGKTLILNHEFDTRTSGVKTHDGIEAEAHKCSVLPVLPDTSAFDTCLVDEAQFFESLVGVEKLAPHVVVAGLSGDYMQRPFGQILSLIPKASKVIFLTAKCSCGQPAPFTKRVSNSTDLISVEAEYVPVCEKCLKI